ncbi:MAG: electron transfer flavoprotein subunit alpha/FixB family protein [Candidatus Methanodesulfokora washburnensis]|jgi:electron transfer flavoprotein alpha subunit
MRALLFASSDDLAFEVISFLKYIGVDEMDSIAFGDRSKAAEYGRRGVKKVFLLRDIDEDAAVDAISTVFKGYDYLATASDKFGRTVAARVSQRMGFGAIMDVISAENREGKILFSRVTLGGKAVSLEHSELPVAIGIKPRKFEQAKPGEGEAEVEEIDMSRKIKILERREKKISGAALDKARIVIGCGMGFKSKDDLKLAYDLAELIGAAVGSSRPLAADLKWMPEERWIGMSGVSIKPDLYIAVGISGQQQHVAGITDSRVIVAVNTDPNAPIFKSADYCINQDLYEFLPALAAAIKRRRGG